MISQSGRGVFALALASLMVLLPACAAARGEVDASGETRRAAAELSLEQQYELLAAHHQRAQQLMEQVQVRVAGADAEWTWISNGLVPRQGTVAPTPLRGGTADNSYFLDIVRALPRTGGDERGLRAVAAYFGERGWDYTLKDHSASSRVRAQTDDGFLIEYEAQRNGQSSLSVWAGPYWGDTRELLHAVARRLPADAPDIRVSVPGRSVRFPPWQDERYSG